jgi:hypothetical protein
MENPAKKLKIDGDLSANPFFELHSDVHPLVLQHFTGKEALGLFGMLSTYQRVASGYEEDPTSLP